MAQGRLTLMDPPIEDLLDKVDSKFTLVALGALRARQVNAYYNSLGEGMGRVVPPQVASVSGKPLSIAFEEIAASKATFVRVDPDELAAEAELELAEAELAVDLAIVEGALEEVAEEVLEEAVEVALIEAIEEVIEEAVEAELEDELEEAEAAPLEAAPVEAVAAPVDDEPEAEAAEDEGPVAG